MIDSRPFPDLRDHVVLAAAIGLATGEASPIAAGAVDVARFSAWLGSAHHGWRSFTAEEIDAAPRPFAIGTPERARLYGVEARINLPVWSAILADAPADVRELLAEAAKLLGR